MGYRHSDRSLGRERDDDLHRAGDLPRALLIEQRRLYAGTGRAFEIRHVRPDGVAYSGSLGSSRTYHHDRDRVVRDHEG